jgi:hypothetical protein
VPANHAGNDRAGARLQAVLPWTLLALLLLLAFHGALGGRLFYLRDISQNHAPLRAYVTERLGAGSLPLWDPYHGGGTPLLANPNALVFHPITLLFFILPFHVAFTLSIVLQFVLLAAGGYLLGRAVGLGREASALAAGVLSLSGPAASLASMQNLLSAAAWVPLALWAFLRGLQPGRRWLLAPAALCAAVVLVAAEPASLLALALVGAVLGTTSRAAAGRTAAPLAALGALSLVLILAVFLAAAQILPARALLPLAERGAGFGAAEGMKWSLAPARLFEAVLPRLFGDPTRLSPAAWWGGFLFEGHYPFLLSLYVGAIPAVLALIGALHRGGDGARRRGLAAAAASALLLALGAHSALYRGLFHAVGPLRQVRYPERFVLVALLALALLAGYGLDRLRSGPPSRRAALAAVAAATGAFALTAAVATPPLADRMLAAVAQVPAFFLASEAAPVVRGGLLRSALWAFAETAFLAAIAVSLLGRHRPFLARGIGWVVVLVSGGSMILAAAPALSSAAPGWLSAPSPLAVVVGHEASAPRLHHAARPPDLSVWAKTDELIWGYRFDRFAYALYTGHPEHVPTALDAATDRMDLKDSADLGRALARLPSAARVRALAACRVGLLLSFAPPEDGGLLDGPILEGFSRPPLRVYRVPGVVPRVRWVGRARPLPPGRSLADVLSDTGYDPNREVLIEGLEAAIGEETPRPGGPGAASVALESPERLVLTVSALEPGFVVVADAFAPGWQAILDGRTVPILRADGLFRAVAVAAGRHELEMVYRPAEVRAGLGLSLAALLVTALLGITAAARRL